MKLFILLFIFGCASTSLLQSISSGHVGCPREEIIITEKKSSLCCHSWVATCEKKKFFCSSVEGLVKNIKCTERNNTSSKKSVF